MSLEAVRQPLIKSIEEEQQANEQDQEEEVEEELFMRK